MGSAALSDRRCSKFVSGCSNRISPASIRWTAPCRPHCPAFCSALARHHRAEYVAALPMLSMLSAQVPELLPLLTELAQDPQLIAGILRRVNELAQRFGTTDHLLGAIVNYRLTFLGRQLRVDV